MPIKSDYSVLRGLKYIEASFINILFRLAPVIAFVASIILLKEQLTLKKASGMTLTVAAALIIAEWKGTLIHK